MMRLPGAPTIRIAAVCADADFIDELPQRSSPCDALPKKPSRSWQATLRMRRKLHVPEEHMATRKSKPLVRARKRPQQARSASLVEDILEAAARVLEREGARRFTT